MSITFDERLARYGLKKSALTGQELIVTSATLVRLSGVAGQHSTYPPRFLRTRDLADLKNWVGVSQRVVEKHPDRFRKRTMKHRPSDDLIRLVKEKIDAVRDSSGHIKPGDRDRIGKMLQPKLQKEAPAIREATRAYLYGDVAKIKDLGILSELLYGEFMLTIWAFRVVRVEHNGVLEFGPGLNSLVVDSVIVDQGGVIRSYGTLKVDCGRFSRS